MVEHMKNALKWVGPFILVAVMLLTFVMGLQPQRDTRQVVAGIAIQAKYTPHKRSPVKPPKPHNSPSGMPYVQGAQVLDGSGHPLLLRGAQIESPLNYIADWNSGTPTSKYLNSAVFTAMVHDWKMNVLRLSISNWIYARAPSKYISLLDTAVQQANDAGLYVILDLHDDAKSGSPYGKNASLPKTEDIAFWLAIASHYKNNAMVMFDVYNEPQAVGWSMWLHGGGIVGGAKVVGTQDLVNAIRSASAKQVIVVEPGSASGSKGAGGWSTVGNNLINDPNIMYSLHVYGGITATAQQEDAKWGPILNHYPIYYGEWALLVNGYGTSGYDHCKNIVPSQANQDVTTFLNYMTSRHANWSAWQFTPYHLIQDYTSYTPTTLDIPWKCGDTRSHAGMGDIVKQFLAGN